LFLTAIAFLIGLSLLSSILVLAAVIRSGQVDRMAEESRRAARRSGDTFSAEAEDAQADTPPAPDWTPADRVASYHWSFHDRT